MSVNSLHSLDLTSRQLIHPAKVGGNGGQKDSICVSPNQDAYYLPQPLQFGAVAKAIEFVS